MSSPHPPTLTGWRDTDGPVELTIIGRSNLVTVQVADGNKFAILPARRSPDDQKLVDTIQRESLLSGRGNKVHLETPDNRHPPAAGLVVVVPRGSAVTFDSLRGDVAFDGWINPESGAKRTLDSLVPASVKLLVQGGMPRVSGLKGPLDAWTPDSQLSAEVFGEAKLHPSGTSIATVSGSGKRLCHALTEHSQVVLRPGELDVRVDPTSKGSALVRSKWDGRNPDIDKGTRLSPGARYKVEANGGVSKLEPINKLGAALGAGLDSAAGAGQPREGRATIAVRGGRAQETGGQAV